VFLGGEGKLDALEGGGQLLDLREQLFLSNLLWVLEVVVGILVEF
jgi:hypothetical protein